MFCNVFQAFYRSISPNLLRLAELNYNPLGSQNRTSKGHSDIIKYLLLSQWFEICLFQGLNPIFEESFFYLVKLERFYERLGGCICIEEMKIVQELFFQAKIFRIVPLGRYK
jgi:hypothetical protein